MPVYFMGRLGARLVEDEEETQAQNKLVFGLLSMLLVYPAGFFFLWALFMYTRLGALMAAGTMWLFARYHDTMINGVYMPSLRVTSILIDLIFQPTMSSASSLSPYPILTEYHPSAKRLLATWRVLMGVWAPKRWELSLAALAPYTTPVFPKESEFITKPSHPTDSPKLPALVPPTPELGNAEPPVKARPKRRPPSRRIMRHVLRARVEAVKALAEFVEQLRIRSVQGRDTGGMRVKASLHLARLYGGVEVRRTKVEGQDGLLADAEEEMEDGWREASEVLAFLTQRGAKIPLMRHVQVEGEWAALSSDAEDASPS
jgi:hypothetical protein